MRTADKDAKKMKSSYTVGGVVRWHSHLGKQYDNSLKDSAEFLYDKAIMFLAVYPQEMKTCPRKTW